MSFYLSNSVVIIFLLSLTGLCAQPTTTNNTEHPTTHLIQTCSSSHRIQDTILENKNGLSSRVLVEPTISDLIKDGYLEASMDSSVWDGNKNISRAYVHVGPFYDFHQMSLDSLSVDLLDRLDIKQPRTITEFLLVRQQLADYYSEHGYPFAIIRLEDLKMSEGVVEGYLDIEERNKIIMDSIIIHGDVKIRQSYLRKYLDIYPGELYDHSKVRTVKRKLDRLDFLKTTEEPGLSFIYDYASLNLYVAPENTSRFDLLFGVIPTNNIAGRQLFLSLDFSAELLNKLGYGEYLFIDFERLRPEQQKLELAFNYPYLLDTPFALDMQFSIFRNALNFQTVNSDLGIQYLLNSSDYVKVAWNLESSKIVEIDTLGLLSSRQLPEQLSVSQSGLAVEYFMTRLDHRFNPRRGLSVRAEAIAGQRKILIDPGIIALSNGEVDFRNSYDTLDLSTPRYQLSADLSYFIPLMRRGVIGFNMKGGWRFTSGNNDLLINEKFQIGGHKLLRGFDEASIFTSYYGVSTVEYRLLLSENSYFSAPFVDVGYIESNSVSGGGQVVVGIGAGLLFETKVGLFNFSIASGRNDQQGFDFGRPKAHFGFSSLF